MIQLVIDSMGIQHTVDGIAKIGISLLPGDWQILAPAISSFVTIITAAIIRSIEKSKIQKNQRREMREIVQAYLEKDTASLSEKINDLQKRY